MDVDKEVDSDDDDDDQGPGENPDEECNYEAKGPSPTCFGMQPNHGGCLLCCYTGYLGIFSSFLV